MNATAGPDGVGQGDGRAEWLLPALVFAVPIVLLLPFAGKPLGIDDQLFVWTAKQIAVDPFDFYGFTVDYGYEEVPIHAVFHNPPLVSYLLALVGPWTGWAETPMHLLMALFAGLGSLGIYVLARDLGAPPSLTCFGAVLTPAFLVSASTLMSDVAMTAFYVWAIVGWRRGILHGSTRWLWVGVVCATLAPLTKYFGITLVPLLFAYSPFHTKRARLQWLYLAIPLAVFGLLQAYLHVRYGTTAFFDAAGVALADKWRREELGTTRPLLTIVFLGGSLLPLAVSGIRAAGWVPSAILAVVGVGVCLPFFDGYALLQLLLGTSEPYAWDELAHFAVFTAAGLILITAMARETVHLEDRGDMALVGLWVLGTLAFTAAINHYVSVRTLLPLLPAAAVLVARRAREPWEAWALVPATLLTMWLTWADYEVAAHDKEAAQEALAEARDAQTELHYVAYWGLEYYLDLADAVPMAFEVEEDTGAVTGPQMEAGDWLIVDSYAADAWRPPPAGFKPLIELDMPYRSRATTFDVHADAGFHSHRIGALPYRIGAVPPERYPIFQWTGKPGE